MTFLELAKARFSVRKFKPDAIEDAKLNAILEAARVAPTAHNNQPQKIFIVKSEEIRKQLAEVCRCTFGAPVIAIIAYDRELDWKNRLMPGYGAGETDAAIVCTHMMLEAWEQGIGSCWVGMFNAEEIGRVLDLPEHDVVSAMLPMGYAADDCVPAGLHDISRELDEMVTIL